MGRFLAVIVLIGFLVANSASGSEKQLLLDRLQKDSKDIDALILLSRLELSESNPKEAKRLKRLGLRYAKQDIDRLRLRTLGVQIERMERNASWALNEYKRGQRIKGAGDFSELHLAIAEVYMDNRDFDAAVEALSSSLRADSQNNPRAEDLFTHVQQIQLAKSLSGSEFIYSNSIARSEMAKLLMEELRVDQYLAATSREISGEISPQGLTDYSGSEFRKEILACNRFNLRSFKIVNGMFHPQRAMTRGELAMLIEDILHAKFKISRTAFIGTKSPFFDVKSNATIFNAVMNSVSRGLLQGSKEGAFEADASVSGAEAILLMHNLKQLLRVNE